MHAIDQFGQDLSHIFSHYETWARRQGINYACLAIFHTLVRQQICTQKQICQLWALQKQTISMACQKLYAQGVIAYLPSDADKREKRLILTEQGQELAVPIIAKLDELERQVVARLGDERMTDFLHTLHQLKNSFEQEMTGDN